MARRPELFRMQGGLNREDPMFTLPPGSAVIAKNYEALVGGGYKRVDGYERFDGLVATPDAAVYDWIAFTGGGPTAPVSGELLTGLTSGATARVAGDPELTTGTWAGNDAAGKIGMTAHNATPFVSGEVVQIGGVNRFTTSGTVQAAALDDASRKIWLAGARNYYRSLISAVPGSGSVLGVFMYGDDVYAIRNNAGGTAAILHKATTGGWSAVTLTNYLRFSGGTAEVSEGATITGASSGHTAVVRRVSIGGGNFAGPTYAFGRFAITGQTGIFQNGEDLQVAAVTVAVAVGTAGTSTLSPGGSFEFKVTNFYGGSNTKRVYGCDGVNRAFEFDGTYFCFIETGMATDVPTHIEGHRNHLFLSFAGGSLQNSSTGLPLTWSVRTGASEIGIGDDITNLFQNGSNTLLVAGRTSLSLLYGTSDLDWNLKAVADSSMGAVPRTCAEVGGTTTFTDASAVNMLTATNAYGDYAPNPISRPVKKLLESSVASTSKFALSITEKGHYRVFFADGTALVSVFGGAKPGGWTQSDYEHTFTCGVAGKDNSNVEQIYCGTSDGYVMKMDVGTSFDGADIESVLMTPYGYRNTPDRKKRFRKVTLEMDTPSEIDLRMLTDFDYGSEGLSTTGTVTVVAASDGTWDFANWTEFFWDSAAVSAPEINIDGVARNIALTFYHSDDVDEPFTIQAVLIQYDIWGIKY